MLQFFLLSFNVALAPLGVPFYEPSLAGIPLQPDEVIMARFPGTVALQETVGEGDPVELNQRLTVHFSVSDGSGRELANTRLRGLPFTIQVQESDFWARVVWGMAKGETRQIFVPREHAFGAQGAPGLIPPDADLWIRVEALEIVRTRTRTGVP